MNTQTTRLNQYFPLLIHIGVITVLLALSVFVSFAVKGKLVPPNFFYTQVWQGFIINLTFFYLLYGMLLNKSFHSRWYKIGAFMLIFFVSITAATWLDIEQLLRIVKPIKIQHYQYLVIVNIVVKSFFAVCAVLTWAMISLIKQKIAYNKIQLNTLQTQLNLLKSQTNPHFLFNTLNAIYTKAYKSKHHELAHDIGQLSSLMRYTLTQTEKEQVMLEDEIDHIEAYIALQSLRVKDATSIAFNYGPVSANLTIPPMLLNPIVENAFKYGICECKKSEINISLLVANHTVILTVINTDYSEQVKASSTFTHSGSGLNNLRQRLTLLFDNNYGLSTISVNGAFETRLTIPCQ